MHRSRLILILLVFISACSDENFVLTGTKKIDHYPSASGAECYDQQLFIIGDDAKYVLILDSNLATTDSIPLYSGDGKKIPKAIKPDLEAMTVIRDKGARKLLIAGSGSLAPYRDIAWLIDLQTKQADSVRLDTFYYRLRASGLESLNIEGLCSIPGALIFSNRGNKGYPKNHLIFTKDKCWLQQADASITLVRIGTNTDTSQFNGVSGLAYSYKSDRLLLTVSTEDTRNNIEDGAIGKSFLWIVKNISSKKRWKAINPDQVIDLGGVDPVFIGQKIESVAIAKETKKFLHLILAADNDNGSSTIFQLVVEKD